MGLTSLYPGLTDSSCFAAAALTEAELLAVCYAPPTDPARENGLYLKQMRILPNRKDIGAIFGDTPPAAALSPTSPTYSMATSRTRDSPRTASSTRGGNQTHRASTISVMSALGVPVSDTTPKPVAVPQAPLPKSPSSGSFLASRGRRMYNFFGHRPPSELISSHLAEYFPAAKRRDLEKGARNSMLRLGSKGELDNLRNSIDSTRHSLDANRLPSRFSVATSNSSYHRMSRASSYKNASIAPADAIPEERVGASGVPRVSVSGDDGQELRPAFDENETMTPAGEAPLLPPFQPSEDSLSDSMPSFESRPRPGSIMQDRRSSMRSMGSRRLSTVSSRRKSRRVSDAASMLTVDEITAEVENRRASVITFAESEEEAEEDNFLAPENIRLSKAYSPGLVPEEQGEDSEEEASEESEEETSDEEESEEDDDEEDEEEEEEDDQHGKAVTSTGSESPRCVKGLSPPLVDSDHPPSHPHAPANRSIKWIRGALIGQGSFGKVYLAMDSQAGLLMAVKQVDLETSGAGSEERKQSMVTAMQQEIALLKDLQHENIVQYLGQSSVRYRAPKQGPIPFLTGTCRIPFENRFINGPLPLEHFPRIRPWRFRHRATEQLRRI